MRTKDRTTSVPLAQEQSTTDSTPVSSPVGRQRRWETNQIQKAKDQSGAHPSLAPVQVEPRELPEMRKAVFQQKGGAGPLLSAFEDRSHWVGDCYSGGIHAALSSRTPPSRIDVRPALGQRLANSKAQARRDQGFAESCFRSSWNSATMRRFANSPATPGFWTSKMGLRWISSSRPTSGTREFLLEKGTDVRLRLGSKGQTAWPQFNRSKLKALNRRLSPLGRILVLENRTLDVGSRCGFAKRGFSSHSR